jgi:hypothetical protein
LLLGFLSLPFPAKLLLPELKVLVRWMSGTSPLGDDWTRSAHPLPLAQKQESKLGLAPTVQAKAEGVATPQDGLG